MSTVTEPDTLIPKTPTLTSCIACGRDMEFIQGMVKICNRCVRIVADGKARRELQRRVIELEQAIREHQHDCTSPVVSESDRRLYAVLGGL